MPSLNQARNRDIFALAIPALGALAAEPTYVLVDTAIVGHIGTTQLAALALAATFLTSAFWVFNFLAYGTTSQIARLHGSGDREGISVITAQAMWLALGIGFALTALGIVFTPQIIALLQASGAVASKAEVYMRISFIGAPFVLLALVAQGYARGVQKMGPPFKILIASNIANALLEVIFVYGFHWNLAGSAWGTVIAQAGAAAAFMVILLRATRGRLAIVRSRMVPLLKIGRELTIRTGSLLLMFNILVALLASHSVDGLAANQVIDQVWLFIALVVDSLAIAAQSLVGSSLGARALDAARDYARRVALLSLAVGAFVFLILAAGHGVIPRAFSDDPAVRHQIARAWWIFAVMQPINAVVFGWDGVLIGAGDTRFLMYAMAFASLLAVVTGIVTIESGMGVVGAWLAVTVLIAARFTLAGWRIASGRWAVVGAEAPA